MSIPLRQALDTRRSEVERIRSVTGGEHLVKGRIELRGVGEITVDVKFPVMFTEMPVVVGGGGVGENQIIRASQFPSWKVGVHRWLRETDPSIPDTPVYKGCTLVIVVEGAWQDYATFESFAFWTASGRALTNPITEIL